jgi:nitrate/nitrite transporter NarK
MALMNFLPTFFIDVIGNTEEGAAILTASAVVCNIPGNIFGGWLSHRNIPRWILLTFSYTVVALTTFGIYSFITPQSFRIILLILFSFIGGIIPGTLLAGVPLHSPGTECLGATNGLITQGSNLGTVFLPPTLAIVVSSAGDWNTAPWIFVITGSLGIISSLGIRNLERE